MAAAAEQAPDAGDQGPAPVVPRGHHITSTGTHAAGNGAPPSWTQRVSIHCPLQSLKAMVTRRCFIPYAGGHDAAVV